MRVGPSWQFKIGGGFLAGKVDDLGELTGDEIVYAYPDFETLLVGKFRLGVMVSAQQSTFNGFKFDRMSGIPMLLYKPDEKSCLKFKFEPSDKMSIGLDPLLPDPYERRWIYVAKSKIPGAGLGLFAATAGRRGKMVGFYNGVRKTKLEAK